MLMRINPNNCTSDGYTTKVNLSDQASFSGDAILTTDYGDDTIVRGKGFTFEKNISLSNGQTRYVLIDYSTYSPGEGEVGLVYALPPVFSSSGGPVVVNVYRGTNYAGGTEFDCINPNTTAVKTTSGTTFTIDPTGDTKGTLVLEYLIGGGSGGLGHSVPGNASGLSFFVRPNSGKSLVEIVNQSGTSVTFHYGQVFFEI